MRGEKPRSLLKQRTALLSSIAAKEFAQILRDSPFEVARYCTATPNAFGAARPMIGQAKRMPYKCLLCGSANSGEHRLPACSCRQPCRQHLSRRDSNSRTISPVPARLPRRAGWQPALPQNRHWNSPVIRNCSASDSGLQINWSPVSGPSHGLRRGLRVARGFGVRQCLGVDVG
jgi:hypothetical protein